MNDDVFSDRLAAWREYTHTPWGRIRYAVVAETLRREAAALGSGLRVLDVGGGDGMDAVPLARAGHDVTILDPSAAWLEEAVRRAAHADVEVETVLGGLDEHPPLGEFDLVLCHFVLQYREAGEDDLRTLAGFLRPGGVLSVMLPNPAGMVLRRLVTEGPSAAHDELDATTKHAVTFDHDVRKIPLAELEAQAERLGLRVVRRCGTRIASDLITDDRAKHDPEFFADLLRLELALSDREPYARVGAMYQLVMAAPAR